MTVVAAAIVLAIAAAAVFVGSVVAGTGFVDRHDDDLTRPVSRRALEGLRDRTQSQSGTRW